MISKSTILFNGFIKKSNYLNIKGENPPKMSIIGWDQVVTKKEDLKDGKWLYVGQETMNDINLQLFILKFHNDGAPIIME